MGQALRRRPSGADVEDLLALSWYDDRVRERFAVARTQALLETGTTDRDLGASEEYERLRDRAGAPDEAVDDLSGEMDEQAVRRAVSGSSGVRERRDGE